MQIAREFGKVFRKFKNGGEKRLTIPAAKRKIAE